MEISSERLAQSIVRKSLRPVEDESVVISTYPHTVDLAQSCALECQKAGADPLIVLDTDAVFYGQFENYTAEQLRRTSAHCLGLVEYVNSYIWLGGPEDPAPMATVPREHFAALFEGEKAHEDRALEKRPKNVSVAVGQVTLERANTYGFAFEKWKSMVEAAIAVDPENTRSAARPLRELLTTPVQVRLAAENGTDLVFQLAGSSRPVDVDDGVISDEDLEAGTASRRGVDLPAGSVWTAPVEDSAEGVFVCDVPVPQRGKLVEGLAWTFEGGRVTDFTAERNVEFAQTNWPEATGDKDRIGALGIGLNEQALPGFLQNPVAAGLVTVAIGDNRWLDGENDSSYGFYGHVARGTLTIGDRTVIEDGQLLI